MPNSTMPEKSLAMLEDMLGRGINGRQKIPFYAQTAPIRI